MKRIIVTFICLGILASFLASCARTTDSGSKPTDTTAKPTSNATLDDGGRKMEGNLYLEGFPIVKDKVTLKFFAPHNTAVEDYFTNLFVVEYEEKTNVHIDWELIPPSGLAEKKNLLFASNDLPDAFFGAGVSAAEAVRYGAEGLLLPIQDLIEKYNPQIQILFEKHPSMKSLLTAPDGNIYHYPNWSECYHCFYPNKMWINVDWLKNVGLERPKTTEEFYQVLKAFKEQDANGNGNPNDEIPFAASTGWSTWPTNWLMNAFILDDYFTHIVINDNKVDFSANKPEYKEGLLFIRRLYKEDLMDKESFTQDMDMLRQKMQNPDISIVGAAPHMHYLGLVGITGDRPDEYDVLAPLKGPAGVQYTIHNPYPLGLGKYVITTACKTPEVAARWIDFFYTEEGLLAQKYGRENEEWYHPTDGSLGIGEGLEPGPARFNWMPGKGWSETLQNITLNQQGPIYEPREFRGAWQEDPASPLEPRLIKATKEYEGFEMKEVWPPIMMTKEETDELAALETQINDYVREMLARFITGDIDIEAEWDNYVNRLEAMNVKRLNEIRQGAYDRFLNN